MVGNRNSGRRPKPLAHHVLAGTYRADRHGPLDDDAVLQVPPKPSPVIRATARSQSRWCRSEADHRAVRNGCRFNEALAEHFTSFCRSYCRHSKGRWAGQPLEFLPWQLDDIVNPLFGWVRPDGTRRFRRTYIEVPKKNGKSTIACGIGLYMLVGDEEPGAEVYSAGADKDQARIVHNEAINMIEASPALDSTLQINRTTGIISYRTTQSYYQAISSAPLGKHGFNIHCGILDELHEWRGGTLWASLKYGYRARTQPLQFVITNAGNDIESVCWSQREYAQTILEGKVHEDSFLAVIYSADPKCDWTNPEEWRKCNPSLDTVVGDELGIVKEDDLRRDAQEAENAPREQANFQRLTLGIWATTVENPWLNIADWNACREQFAEEDLLGRECYGGLDLSKTRDMTAFVLCFPDGDDRYLFLFYFWLPEDATIDPKSKNHQLYREWAESGALQTTPGNWIDYAYVREQVQELAEKFSIVGIGYDPKFADQLVQSLQEEDGLTFESVPQKPLVLTDAISEFERLVLKGGAVHNGHPIMEWQVGHAKIIRSPLTGLLRITKPAREDHRKIDGVAASIMAISVARQPDLWGESIYEEEGQVAL